MRLQLRLCLWLCGCLRRRIRRRHTQLSMHIRGCTESPDHNISLMSIVRPDCVQNQPLRVFHDPIYDLLVVGGCAGGAKEPGARYPRDINRLRIPSHHVHFYQTVAIERSSSMNNSPPALSSAVVINWTLTNTIITQWISANAFASIVFSQSTETPDGVIQSLR